MPDPFYEKLITRHFPAWAARREAARFERDRLATYRGAIATRSGNTFGSGRTVRNGTRAERYDLLRMCYRSREVYRENPIARSLIEKEMQYVVGDGFTVQAKSKSPEFNKEAEAKWYRWLDRADVTGQYTGEELQQMAWRESRIDGDGGFVLAGRGTDSFLQYIPRDLISTPREKLGDKTVFDGIEVDAAMRPTRYWIEDLDQDGKSTWTPIFASNFIHVTIGARPLHLRPAPVFEPIFEKLDILDRYINGVATAAEMATIFGLIFREENPAKTVQGLDRIKDSVGNERRAITLENQMIKYVGEKGEVAQVQATQPMQQTPEFIRAMSRICGIALDMPLEIAMQDLSQVNFSGARVGLMGFYRACLMKETSYKSKCWSRIYRWFISREVKFGKFTSAIPADYLEHELHGQERELNDRLAEAQADLLEIDANLRSPQQVIGRRGGDPDDVIDQKQKFIEKLKTAGLALTQSTLTRDTTTTPQGTSITVNTGEKPDGSTAVDEESAAIDKLKIEADSYGVQVRAGAITPQIEDEEHFRQKSGLPAMSAAAKEAWAKDKGVRRPITLAIAGETAPAPANPDDTEETP